MKRVIHVTEDSMRVNEEKMLTFKAQVTKYIKMINENYE